MNIARHIHSVPDSIVNVAFEHFSKIDPAYAAGAKAAIAKVRAAAQGK